MTFWLDAHLDPDLCSWLGSRFKIFVKGVREIGLRDVDDSVLYDAAKHFGKVVIVTKDSDFVELVQRKGIPPQVLWLRCGNLSTLELQMLLSRKFQAALDELNSGEAIVQILGT